MKKLLCTCLLITLLCHMTAINACPALAEYEPIDSPPVQLDNSIEVIEELPVQSDELNLDISLDDVFEGDMTPIDMGGLDLDWTDEVPLIQEDENLPETVEASSPSEPDAENTKSDSDLRSDFYYYKIVDGNAVITDVEEEPVYNDKGDIVGWDKLQYVDVAIPEAIDGCPVTRIDNGVFKNAKNLQKVTFPEGLKEIGNGTFANCESLSAVTLPAGLELLDCNAFCNCTSLASINIPLTVKTHPYVTEIAYPGPFNGSGLSEVRFADGIVSVEPGLFQNCTSLESLSLPASITKICRGAFMGCSSLKRIDLPASLRQINWGAFDGCKSLSDIVLPAKLEYLDCNVFNGCKSLKKINLPRNVRSHDYVTERAYSGPFVNCEGLREIVFADGMETVPKGIFFRCPGIRSITIPNTVKTIEYGAFEECANLVTVKIPNSVTRIEDYAFGWSSSLKNITLPAKLGYLGLGAFKGCKALSKINIPAKVEMHGYVAENSYYPGPFSECSGLRTVTFAKGMTAIPHGLFYQCDGIQKITIPNSIVTIERDAFCNCDGLTQVKFGKKVQGIESYAFSYCDSLKTVSFQPSTKRIENYAFGWCPKLKGVTLPSGLTYLGLGAFKGCKALTKINIPKKLRTNDYCGSNKSNPGPFSECSGLRTVTFAKGITVIPNGLFYQCDGIRKIILPESIVTIEGDAFCRCSALTEIHIGVNLTAVRNYAFYECNKLKDVFYDACKVSWSKVEIDSNNEPLQKAKFHYGKKVTKISLNKKGTFSMSKKDTFLLKATLAPKGVKSRLVWKSSNSAVVKVTQDGKITAIKNGQATITVTAANGKNASVKIEVTPVCRALLIGEVKYKNGNSSLPGCKTDIDMMEKMLKKVKGPGGRPWKIIKKTNLEAREIIDCIDTTFKGAGKDDVSLFYFSGHGDWIKEEKRTALCATDITFPVDNLVDPLNAVPGKMILIIDACHSGGMIEKNGGESDLASEIAAFDNGVVDTVRRVEHIQPNNGEFCTNKFFVLTACQFDETSISNRLLGGYFTWWLVEGMNINNKTKHMKADDNNNNEVTLNEVYTFIKDQGPNAVSWNKNHIQHVQVYPDESTFVLFQK